MTGEAFTIGSVRAATLLYVVAVAVWLTTPSPRGRKAARFAWTAGCLCYLTHVVGAFQFFHGWSHTAAYVETARQTRELMGISSGSGLYFNYVFTVVWAADVVWWRLAGERYERRPRWITATVHAFLAFMFFNATVVFASGFSRWLGIAATPALVFAWWIGRGARRGVRESSRFGAHLS